MDEDKLKRYWDKINLISKRSTQIKEWTAILPEDIITDEKTKLATYKAFQEIVEACMDIVAMMCKDLKIPPKDDYTNIEILKNNHFEDMESLIEAKETLHLDYDIKIFESMPLFLKIKVIENHKIVYTRDILDFYEYLYFFRKFWKDQEHRQKMTKKEALHIFG